MTRVLSGIQPSGAVHLGNLLGALRNWAEDQDEADTLHFIADLHALTLPIEPAALREATIGLATLLVAVGIDPDRSTLFVQSHVPQHAELAWVLQCVASYGELSRMTAFKEKSTRGGFVSAGLFTYPALQAADILLYDADRVPVGDDQRQHLELTRDVAERFNTRYGPTFVVPEAAIPRIGARVMDLQNPDNKMSKSVESPQGTIFVLEDLKAVEKKIKRAVTDTETEVRFDPVAKPGVSNLLSILAACTGRTPEECATGYQQYGPLKADTAAAVASVLEPVQARYRELAADPGAMATILEKGSDRARSIASVTLAKAHDHIGLLPRP